MRGGKGEPDDYHVLCLPRMGDIPPWDQIQMSGMRLGF